MSRGKLVVQKMKVDHEKRALLEATAAPLVQAARLRLVKDSPLMGRLVMSMTLVPTWEDGTAWTNGLVIAYNPAWVLTMTPDALVGLLAHECMHMACEHPIRQKERQSEAWNKACDKAINRILEDASFNMPFWAEDAEREKAPWFRTSMCAEQIYPYFAKPESPEGGQGGEGEGEGEGDDSQEGAGGRTGKKRGRGKVGEVKGGRGEQGDEDEQEDDDDEGEADGDSGEGDGDGDDGDDGRGEQGNDSTGDGADGDGDSGGGGGGEDGGGGGDDAGAADDNADEGGGDGEQDVELEVEEEEVEDDLGRPGSHTGRDVRPVPKESEDEARALRNDAMAQGRSLDRACGNEHSSLIAAIEAQVNLPPTANELVRRFLLDACNRDYSWRRPCRRHDPNTLYLPSLRAEGDGHVVMVVDVSGSVSGVEGKVQRLIGEVWSSAVDLGVGATLLFCDTELRQCRAKGVPEFRNFIDIERGESIPTDIEFGYGGGTSYGPVFEYIRERFGDKISALIYATDGECASPIPDTPYPQLWLIPRSDCIEQSLNERWPWPAYYGFGSGAWCAPPVYGSSMSPYDWTKVRASFPHSVIAIDDTLTDPYHDQEGDA